MSKQTLREIYNNGWDEHIEGNNDKGSVHSYIELYEEILAPYRDVALNMLEIGVAKGYSLRMWREYFHEGCDVHGIDIKKIPLIDETLNVSYGDSQDAALWADWGPVDVIIDDGDHSTKGQFETALVWLPKVRRGGVYLIEDVYEINREYYNKAIGQLKNANTEMIIHDKRELSQREDDVLVEIRIL